MPSTNPLMRSRSAVVLAAVLRAVRPLVRLLLRHGVAYPSFASALKQLFLQAAVDELRATGRKQTDSALSLLSGVHRRDVRELGRLESARIATEEPMNMASLVASVWLTDAAYVDGKGAPREIARAGRAPSFDALVSSVSSDVRPRAVLDELVRLGMAREDGSAVRLLQHGFVPRHGFEELAALHADNLFDHAAAASLNLDGQHNYLEQAVSCDELTLASVQHLHGVSAAAWRQAFTTVMREVHERHRHDSANASSLERVHRMRFGSYFFACDDNDQPS